MVHPALPCVVDATSWSGDGAAWQRCLAARQAWLPAHGFVHRLVVPGASGLLSRSRAAASIDAAAPDLVETADPLLLAWACLDVAQRRAIPAIAFCHGELPRRAARRLGAGAERAAQRYLARVYDRFDLVLAPSRSMLRALRGWGVERVQHQPLGVDVALFHPQRRDPRWRHDLLRAWQRPAGTRLLVYAGRLAADRRLELLADAVALLGPGHLLLLVGDGPRVPRGHHVQRLRGVHDDAALARLLASADVFVHAGDDEPGGGALLQAMACGTRVVVGARDALGELAAGVGTTVDSERAQLWAEALADALSTAAPRQVEAALQRARAHDWPLVVAQMARRYAALLGRGDGDRDALPGSLPSDRLRV